MDGRRAIFRLLFPLVAKNQGNTNDIIYDRPLPSLQSLDVHRKLNGLPNPPIDLVPDLLLHLPTLVPLAQSPQHPFQTILVLEV